MEDVFLRSGAKRQSGHGAGINSVVLAIVCQIPSFLLSQPGLAQERLAEVHQVVS